jgi:MoxR-like ATPase
MAKTAANRSFALANLTRKQKAFVAALVKAGITQSPVSRQALLSVSEDLGMAYPPAWIAQDQSRRAGRGEYLVPEVTEIAKGNAPSAPATVVAAVAEAKVTPVVGSDSIAATLLAATGGDRADLIPTRVDEYVPFGNFKDLECIIRAAMPKTNVWISGLSGNGKTMMVEQVCAKLKRECIRVQITNLTDEDDLIGGFRLIDGNTVWQDGPVILALQRGAVLLLDEIDYGTSKLSCLQSVLEGNGVFVKQTNRKVVPAKGFLVIATANTKGQGDDTGKFIGTNGMNEAFLERFGVTMWQPYAPGATEKKILEKKMAALGITPDAAFVANLVQWADTTRATYEAGGRDSLISTRRLVNVVELFAIFGEREKAIKYAIERFDRETKEAFWQLYTKIDAEAVMAADPKAAAQAAAAAGTASSKSNDPNACPF